MNLPKLVFKNAAQVASMEANGQSFILGIGELSPFANRTIVPVKPICSEVVCSPYDIWFGMTRRLGDNLQGQMVAGIRLVEWIASQIGNNGLDPYGEIPISSLPNKLRQYVVETRMVRTERQPSLDRADIYLVNGLYHVAVNVSENPELLSAQYGLLPSNEIEYSVVYNPNWGRTSIGANTVHSMPHPSLAMQVFQNLAAAREWYQRGLESQQELTITIKLNLDVLTALMLMMGYDLPAIWVEYVQSLKFGNFDDRPNRQLPSLVAVGQKLTELETGTKGTWGGSPTFQGSPMKERTSLTDLTQVLDVLAATLPLAFAGAEPSVILLRQGKR